MFNFPSVFTERARGSSDLIITPENHNNADENFEAILASTHDIPYVEGVRNLYEAPVPINTLIDTEAFATQPIVITNESGISIKKSGETECYLPNEFAQFSEFVQKIINFEQQNSAADLFKTKEAKLLVYYEDGYDFEPAGDFHCDPHTPVIGKLHNLFVVASIAGTEYAKVPNPKKNQISAIKPNEINYIGDGCNHRRPCLWEDISRTFAAVVTTVSKQELEAINYSQRLTSLCL